MITANWIKVGSDIGSVSPCFKKTISFGKKIKSATLNASAMGLYSAYINGARVSNYVFAPGWTSYNNRIQYQTYDITDMISENSAEISLIGGKGWAMSGMMWKQEPNMYADHISVIACIDVTYEDGSTEHFETDDTWDVYKSHILYSEIYNGETVDLTSDEEYVGKAELDEVKTELVAQVGEFVAEHERVAPMEIITTPKGERVIDFGQNMAGYVEIRAHGNRGDKIVITHAEVLDNDGNFYNENLRTAKCENTYVLSGGDDVFKPSFTFQGFRYIRLDEYPFETIDPSLFTAVAVYSDMERTGFFACGNEKINQLYHNVLWGQRSNYLDVPTDCPQRDERLGWTGDAQVFCRAAAYNYNVKKFFRKWLGDVALDQLETGGITSVVPDVLRNNSSASAWGDAACIIPWQMYLTYGDKKMLEEEFPMMEKWVNYIRHCGRVEELWLDRWHYGDWLALEEVGGQSCGSHGATQRDLIASAFYAYSTECLVKAGHVIGKDVSEYEALYARIHKAFCENFIENGLPCMSKIVSLRDEQNRKEQPIIKASTQTSCVLMLRFKLYRNEEEKESLVKELVRLIHENGDRIATGFVGTPYILHVLSENGYADVAYTLLLQEKMPSWLYSVNHGATTMWERWNCVKEDGTFSDVKMTSFNHYAYGAVADWLYGGAAGISVLEDGVGYEHISFCPHPSRLLGHVNCKIKTNCGEVVSKWYYGDGHIHYEFIVPDGAKAELKLPDGTERTLESGEYLFTTKE